MLPRFGVNHFDRSTTSIINRKCRKVSESWVKRKWLAHLNTIEKEGDRSIDDALLQCGDETANNCVRVRIRSELPSVRVAVDVERATCVAVSYTLVSFAHRRDDRRRARGAHRPDTKSRAIVATAREFNAGFVVKHIVPDRIDCEDRVLFTPMLAGQLRTIVFDGKLCA